MPDLVHIASEIDFTIVPKPYLYGPTSLLPDDVSVELSKKFSRASSGDVLASLEGHMYWLLKDPTVISPIVISPSAFLGYVEQSRSSGGKDIKPFTYMVMLIPKSLLSRTQTSTFSRLFHGVTNPDVRLQFIDFPGLEREYYWMMDHFDSQARNHDKNFLLYDCSYQMDVISRILQQQANHQLT
jgi:hypothetical protein